MGVGVRGNGTELELLRLDTEIIGLAGVSL